MSKNNTSGIKGVHFDKATKKWKARIKINGKLKYLGSFDNIEDAKTARQNKAIELFGNYLNKCEM
jgi:hypothetical protein